VPGNYFPSMIGMLEERGARMMGVASQLRQHLPPLLPVKENCYILSFQMHVQPEMIFHMT
jgi:hypothetical protein